MHSKTESLLTAYFYISEIAADVSVELVGQGNRENGKLSLEMNTSDFAPLGFINVTLRPIPTTTNMQDETTTEKTILTTPLLSLAERLKIATVSKELEAMIFEIPDPKNAIVSSAKSISVTPPGVQNVSKLDIEEPKEVAENAKFMSLAERLAAKNRINSNPSTGQPLRSETFSQPKLQMSIQKQNGRVSELNGSRHIVATNESDGRIPVRKVDQLPKITMPIFPIRSSPKIVDSTDSPIATTPSQTSEQTTLSTTTLLDSTLKPTESSLPASCPELQCLDGKCISIDQINDGVRDCIDGNDEQDFASLLS